MRPAFPGQPTTILVDLCHYDPNANLQAAADAGVAAVMLKATEGATFRDPAFATLLARAQDAGLLTGAYHFGTAADPAAQLDNFITAVTAAAGGFGQVAAVLDVETNTPNPAETMHPDQAEQWAAGLRARTGCTPFIYAGAYLREHGGATSRPNLASCPLWLAQYGRHPQPLPGWTSWTLWQFTDGHLGPYAGTVPGIGRCDQSAFRGAPIDLAALWSQLAGTPVAVTALS
jgi:lysozyme